MKSSITKSTALLLICAVSCLTLLSLACATHKLTKTYFVENPDRLEPNGDYPFRYSWFAERKGPSPFTKIKIGPINTDNLTGIEYLQTNTEAFERSMEDRQKDVEQIKMKLRKSIEKVFSKKDSPLSVTDFADSETVILELAIVQLTPYKAGQLAFVVDSAVMGGEESLEKGTIVMEGQVRHGGTGQLIGMFVDQENMKFRLLRGPSQFSRYGFAEKSINKWAKQFYSLAKIAKKRS